MHEDDIVFVRCRDDEKAFDEEFGCYWYYDGATHGVNPYPRGEFGALKMRRTTVTELKREVGAIY